MLGSSKSCKHTLIKPLQSSHWGLTHCMSFSEKCIFSENLGKYHKHFQDFWDSLVFPTTLLYVWKLSEIPLLMEARSSSHSYMAIFKLVHACSVTTSSSTLLLESLAVLMYLSNLGFGFSTHRHTYISLDVILIWFESRDISFGQCSYLIKRFNFQLEMRLRRDLSLQLGLLLLM